MRSTLLGTFAVIAGIYIGIMAAMFFMQRSLMYLPNTTPVIHPLLAGARSVMLEAVDGIKILAWELSPQQEMPYVVYFHGNAGSIVDRTEKLAELANRGFGIMAVSYRGYGGSDGLPSEEGLYNDARAAIKHLKDQGVAEDRMIFYGESLGSGIAVQMATEFTAKALVLEAPYTSVARRAQEIYFFIPTYFLVRDRYDSIDKIANVKSPLLIMHGEKDLTIPVSHGKKLFAAANEPKQLKLFPTVGHTDFPVAAIADAVYNASSGN